MAANMSLDAMHLLPTKRDPENLITASALFALVRAQRSRQAWHMLQLSASELYGDGDGRLISGIVRSHFPNGIKTRLREYCRDISAQTDAAMHEWHKAGRRLSSLRPYLELSRRLDDGSRSFY